MAVTAVGAEAATEEAEPSGNVHCHDHAGVPYVEALPLLAS